MFKKLTALLLAIVMMLSLTACIKSEDSEESENFESAVVKKALELIDDGDIEGAYNLLYNLKDRTEEEEEFFERFAFVPVSTTKTEDGQTIYVGQYAYNDDGYLLVRNVSDTKYEYSIYEANTYDKNNNLLTYSYTHSDGGSYNVVHTYDENGNMLTSKYGEHITEEFTYHSNGTMATYTYKTPDNAAMLYSIYAPQLYLATYDENGNMLSEKTVRNNGGDKSTTETVYTYDEKGNLLTIDSTDSYDYWEKDINTYDEYGNCLSYNSSNSRGEWTSKTYTYDKDGNKLTENSSSSFFAPSQTEYTYDKDGNLITEKTTYSDGGWKNRIYTYDENGNNLTYNYTTDDGDWEKKAWTYEHNNILTYDYTSDNGDWKKEVYTYDKSGNKLTCDYTDNIGTYVKETWTYDELGRVLSYEKTDNDDTYSDTYSYDEQGNKTYERAGWTITCDKYGNIIKEYSPANADNPFGLESFHSPEQTITHTYKLMYYPDGAPQVTAANTTRLSSTPRPDVYIITDYITGASEPFRTYNFYYYSNVS